MEFDLEGLQLLPADETGLAPPQQICSDTCSSNGGMTCTWTCFSTMD